MNEAVRSSRSVAWSILIETRRSRSCPRCIFHLPIFQLRQRQSCILNGLSATTSVFITRQNVSRGAVLFYLTEANMIFFLNIPPGGGGWSQSSSQRRVRLLPPLLCRALKLERCFQPLLNSRGLVPTFWTIDGWDFKKGRDFQTPSQSAFLPKTTLQVTLLRRCSRTPERTEGT